MNIAFQYKLNERFNKAISYYLVRIYIFDINSSMLFEIIDIIVGNINIF
jgi:hypothetical protein